MRNNLAYPYSNLTTVSSDLAACFVDLSNYTIAEAMATNPSYIVPRIGYIIWNSAIAPDNAATFVFFTRDTMMAFSISGKIYLATSVNPNWVLKNS